MGQIKDAFKVKWTAFWIHAINNPKTSLIGLLGLAAVIATAMAPFIPPTHFFAKVLAVIIAVSSAVARAYIGLTLKDSGYTPVTTPDNPTPHPEPSTEIPLNPDAQIVPS